MPPLPGTFAEDVINQQRAGCPLVPRTGSIAAGNSKDFGHATRSIVSFRVVPEVADVRPLARGVLTVGQGRVKFQTLRQMAVVLTYAASVPVVKVGRMAGQFGKPRSAATEVRDGVELPVCRGDAVNGIEFTAAARTPDPGRLPEAYHCASATLNLCRSLASAGYADLRQVHAWNQDFVAGSPAGQRYEQLADEIDRAITFMHACGADPGEFRAVEFYARHHLDPNGVE